MSDGDDKGKIVMMQGGGMPDAIKEALRKMEVDLPVLIAYVKLTAELQRAKFMALKEQGFTDGQALELSKKVF